jgi:uncharacterized membrane protein YbhN (UPF0104 family)
VTLLRVLGGPAVLLVVLALVDVPEVLARLGDLRPGWVAAALGIAALQVVVSAWRWRFTSARLGAELPLSAAIREYWLAGFLNQVIPGGVVGDVSRAVRHARDDARDRPGRRAVHAVVLERLSGQVVVGIAALASAAVLLTPMSGPWVVVVVGAGMVAGAVSAGSGPAASWTGAKAADEDDATRSFRADLRHALFHPDALAIQLATSSAVVASYVAVYLAAARAVGVETPFVVLLPLVTPVLLAMLVPVSVAGWGVREGAAAAIWAAAGLNAADGVAISVAYGVLVLVSTLPGALVLVLDGIRGRRAAPASGGMPDPGRRADRSPAGGAGPGSAARPTARPPAGG